MAFRALTLVKKGLLVLFVMCVFVVYQLKTNGTNARDESMQANPRDTRDSLGMYAVDPEHAEYHQRLDIRNLTEGMLAGRLLPQTQSNHTESPKQQRTPTENNPIDNYNQVWMDEMEEIRSRRIKHKQAVCKESRHIRSGLPSRHQFDLTYANDDHHFLVTTVWKIGASHWKKVFRILHDNGSVEFRKRQPDPHYPMSKMRDFSTKFAKYYKVIFVRHPFARLVSAYRDKVGGTKIPFYRNKNREMLRKVRPKATVDEIQAANVTFLEFITWVASGGHNSDLHWRGINTKYSICQIPYDFIGKLESISDDTTYLFKLLGVEGLVTYRGAYNHTGSGDEAMLKEYYSNIPNKMITKLSAVYDKDFRVFGYRKPQNNSDFVDANDLRGL